MMMLRCCRLSPRRAAFQPPRFSCAAYASRLMLPRATPPSRASRVRARGQLSPAEYEITLDAEELR